MFADGRRRRAGDDQVAQVPIDDLAALVDLGGHALEDGGGGEAAVGLVGGGGAQSRVFGRAEIAEQGLGAWSSSGAGGADRATAQPAVQGNCRFSRQMEEVLQNVCRCRVTGPASRGGRRVQAKNCVGGAPSVRRTMAVKALALA